MEPEGIATGRVVLDTGVFFHPKVLWRLAERPEEVVVPAVAFAERVRQLTRDGLDHDRFLGALASLQFSVEPFSPIEAVRFVPRLRDDARWARHFRDAMIAGHVHPSDELWTTNAKDFLALGVPDEQVVAVG